MSERALPPASHETRDVPLRVIAALFGLTGALLLLLTGLAWLMFPGEIKDRRFTEPFPVWPTPQLQTDPAADLRQFQAAELERLNSAGWNAGTLHIPVDQAMRMVAAEGIPGWPSPVATSSQGAVK
jgi:hypothetical protein